MNQTVTCCDAVRLEGAQRLTCLICLAAIL
jgi:hypothetical protein